MNTFDAPAEGQEIYLTLPAERCIIVHKDTTASMPRDAELPGVAA